MALTQAQILQKRNEFGIPAEGFGFSFEEQEQGIEPSEDRIASFRNFISKGEQQEGGFISPGAQFPAGRPQDLLIGAAKGVGSTIAGISELGQRGLGAITGIEAGERPEALKEALTPQGLLQKIGFTTEQIAEFFVPGAKVARATKGLGLAKRAGAEAVTAAGVAAAQEGEVGREALIAGGVSAAIPLAAAPVKSFFKPESLIKKALGIKPSEVKKIDKIAKQGGYKGVNDFVLQKGLKGSRDDIADGAAQLFNEARQSKKEILATLTKKTPNTFKELLDEIKGAFDFPGQEKIVKEIDTFAKKKVLTAVELDRIRFLGDDILPRSSFTDITPKKTEGLQNLIDPIRKRLSSLDESGVIKAANADIRVLFNLIPATEESAKKAILKQIGVSSLARGVPSIAASAVFPAATPIIGGLNLLSLIADVPQVSSQLAQFVKKSSEQEGVNLIQQIIKSIVTQQAKERTKES